jgi:amidohydrolase
MIQRFPGRPQDARMTQTLREAAQEILPQLVAWRRHLHMHPELSGEEEETARYVAGEMRQLGYDVRERIGATWGLTAMLAGGSGAAVALRADMDALPIEEETGVEYASRRKGVMHACGHDAHMAMLLGAAKLLRERQAELPQPVKFIFQPAEESGGGAEPMITAGVLDGVGCAFGLHIWSEMPCGTVGLRSGAFMSSPSALTIVVHGEGGHAAMPQQCVDPVVVGAEIVLALQTIVSRSLGMCDHGVVSVTQIKAGSANNVIPPRVELGGTIRTISEATFGTISRRVREIAEGVAMAHGAKAEVTIERGYPALVNDKQMVERLLAAAREVGFAEDDFVSLPIQGGGEDFAYFAQKVPAAFAFLGARNEGLGCHYPHHHARFNLDESAMPLGVALLAQVALGRSDIHKSTTR